MTTISGVINRHMVDFKVELPNAYGYGAKTMLTALEDAGFLNSTNFPELSELLHLVSPSPDNQEDYFECALFSLVVQMLCSVRSIAIVQYTNCELIDVLCSLTFNQYAPLSVRLLDSVINHT